MNQSAVTTTPVSDGVRQALEISLRGVQELLPQDEWVKKLARSEATANAPPPPVSRMAATAAVMRLGCCWIVRDSRSSKAMLAVRTVVRP